MGESQGDPQIVSSVPLNEADADADDLEKRNKALQNKQSLELRKHYAYVVSGITIGQICLTTMFFLLEGIGTFAGCPDVKKCWHFTFHVSDDLFKTYMWAASAVVAIGFWVTRSLFPAESHNFLDFLASLFGKKSE
jgi:hypothetical protein